MVRKGLAHILPIYQITSLPVSRFTNLRLYLSPKAPRCEIKSVLIGCISVIRVQSSAIKILSQIMILQRESALFNLHKSA